MNWDISIGRLRQLMGRAWQTTGRRVASRKLVLNGEAMEYAGRLQMRYGTLKHQAQWGNEMEPAVLQRIPVSSATRKNYSV